MGIIRKTKSVKALLKVFENSVEALSVVDLVERMQAHMNKTTVYRILERLENDGVLHSFTGKGGLKWYAKCKDCSSSHHHDVHPHFQCQNCGKTECLNFALTIPEVSNYKIDSVELLLVGQCEACISQ